MNSIKVWNFEDNVVRTLEVDGKPFFVGKDVTDVLGYSNHRDALATHVDDDDKRYLLKSEIATLENVPNRGLTVINESGLYSLILGSKLPNAKKFKKWVTSEVLPSIRKHGLYATEELINNPDLMIAAFTALKEEREKTRILNDTVAVQNQQIAELKPKASYYDVVLNCKDLVSTSKIAKDYGWSAIKMNAYLHERGVQFKQGDIWLLYQKYANCGYTSTKTHTYSASNGSVHSKIHTYWTQQGRLFLYGLLKDDNILPVMEREAAKQ